MPNDIFMKENVINFCNDTANNSLRVMKALRGRGFICICGGRDLVDVDVKMSIWPKKRKKEKKDVKMSTIFGEASISCINQDKTKRSSQPLIQ